jgi:hypothetical protein
VGSMIGDCFFEKQRLSLVSSYCKVDWDELEACINGVMKCPFNDHMTVPGEEEDPVRIVR